MRPFCLTAIAVLMACTLMAGQTPSTTDHPAVSVFAGYTFASTDLLETPEVVPGERTGFHGGTFDFTWNASKHVGLTAQFSTASTSQDFGFGKADGRITTFLFGPKLTQQVDQFELYAHTLFGGAHASIESPILPSSQSDTDFALAIGGGVDWVGHNHSHFGWRVVQLEYTMAQVFGSHTSYDRVSTGVIFRW